MPQQPEVGHPGFPGGGTIIGWPLDSSAAQQVGSQGVDRLQDSQAAQGGLDAPGRGGPRRVLVVGAVSIIAGLTPYRTCGGKGGTVLGFQMSRVVVVQGEPFREVRWQFPLGVKLGPAGGAGLLPGAGVPVVGHVERIHGLPGQEPAALAPFGHAPQHELQPAAPPQVSQHPPYPVLVQAHYRGQVGHAGQGASWP